MIGLPVTPTVTMILAENQDGVIGVDNKIPWYNAKDLQFYKHNTLARVVIVGRKTFESLPPVALRGRTHVVVTRDPSGMQSRPQGKGESVYFVSDVDTAFMVAYQLCRDNANLLQGIVFSGGADIYKTAVHMGLVDEVLVTRVQAEIPADAKDVVRAPTVKGGVVDYPLAERFTKENATWQIHLKGGMDIDSKMFFLTRFNSNLKLAGIK